MVDMWLIRIKKEHWDTIMLWYLSRYVDIPPEYRIARIIYRGKVSLKLAKPTHMTDACTCAHKSMCCVDIQQIISKEALCY